MWTRNKSLKSRSRRARRKQSKFITPELALFNGQLLRFVANEDSPLSEAERLRAKYAVMDHGNDAEVRQFLQRVYFVALQFRRRRGEFERLQAHAFWKQTGQKKPRDSSNSKWVLLFIMQATTTDIRKRARKFAVILDGLVQDQVEIGAVAARIKQLGGIDAAYEAMQARKRTVASATGTVAVAETAAAGRTRRDDQPSPPKIGEPVMLKPTNRARRRGPEPTFPNLSLGNLFDEEKFKPHDEWLCVEGGHKFENVPAESAFDFVQRLAGEYAEIQEGDHQSVRRVLQRAYLAARKMQCEPDEFARLQADPFWKASSPKPQDASTSKWVVYFILQARAPSVRLRVHGGPRPPAARRREPCRQTRREDGGRRGRLRSRAGTPAPSRIEIMVPTTGWERMRRALPAPAMMTRLAMARFAAVDSVRLG
jgi:hypothetical protein